MTIEFVTPDAPASFTPSVSIAAFTETDLFTQDAVVDFSILNNLLTKYRTTWVRVLGEVPLEKLQPIFDAFQIPAPQIANLYNYSHSAHLAYFSTKMIKISHIIYFNSNHHIRQQTFFLGEKFLLSFHQEPNEGIEYITSMLSNQFLPIRFAGPDLLLYYFLNFSVDSYLHMSRHIGNLVNRIATELVQMPEKFSIIDFSADGAIISDVKKNIWLQRDVLSQLEVIEHRGVVQLLIQPCNASAFEHCANRTSQVLNLLDSIIDNYNGLIDIYFSSNSNQINQIMKTLTIFSAIFLPLSFLAGLWGMNFDYYHSHWNMPELHWKYGYPFAWAVMLTIATTLLIIFRKVGWIRFKKKS